MASGIIHSSSLIDLSAGGGGSGNALFTNKPSGWTTIVDETWGPGSVPGHNQNVNGWWRDEDGNGMQSWYAGSETAPLSIVTDVTSPAGPSTVLKGVWQQDAADAYVHDPAHSGTGDWDVHDTIAGGGPFKIGRQFKGASINSQTIYSDSAAGYKKLYFATWQKHSSNFQSRGIIGQKWIWVYLTGDGNTTSLYSTFHGGSYSTANGFNDNNDPGFDTRMSFGWNQQGSVSRDNITNAGSAGDVYGRRGSWVKYETLMQMNSAEGVSDGICKQWIDGELVLNLTNMNYAAGSLSTRGFAALVMNPTYGGVNSSTHTGRLWVPNDMFSYNNRMLILGSD